MFDVLIAGGDVYDGSGVGPVPADVGVCGDRVAAVGRGLPREAGTVVEAAGKAVCPGFINILSHSNLSILHDPRSLGELTQGVTTEVFGEGVSMGPLTPRLKAELEHTSRYLDVEVSWTRLSEYLRHVERRGAAQNVASFIGAGTLRAGAVGYGDRPATPAELDQMRGIAAEEMADGALGIASALVYPPGSYAGTGELASLCEVAADYDGCYASHVRGEGEQLHAALGEFLRIVREAGLRGEVFHLKAMGRQNWHLMDGAISLIEDARSDGLPVTADVYPYTAGSSGLTRIIPDRYHEGGAAALYDRLDAPEVRAAIRAELAASGRWGDVTEAQNVLILRVAAEENRKWQGRTLAEVAAARGTDPVETAMDLIASDRSRIQAAFFSMSEANLRAALRRPWVGICSDSASMAPEGPFLRAPVHPRAYGSFARVLGHYVRDEKVLPLADEIRRMSGLPAATLGLSGRAEAKNRTRQLLLEAAASVFARKGFAGASVEEIAEAAGFSIGAVYSNFGSKEELFLELSAAYRSDLIAEAAGTVREHGTGTGELGRLLTRAADKDADFALLHSEFWAYAVRNPRVLDTMAARLDAPRQALEALVRADLEQRGAPPEASAAAVATVVAALFDGLARQRLLDPARVPDDLFGFALKWLFTGIGAAAGAAAPPAQPGPEGESH